MKAPFTAETPPKTIPSADVEIHKQPPAILLAVQTCDTLSDGLKEILTGDIIKSLERKTNLITRIKKDIQTLITWLTDPTNS